MKKILHTMLRVNDLNQSVNFYTHVMGMKLLRTLQQPSESYTLAFLGYGREEDTAVLELTYNYGVTKYTLGNAYGHIAVGVDNIREERKSIKEKGGKLTLDVTELKGSNELIAFVIDPDGYQIELIERKD